VERELAQRWIDRYEACQEFYVADREERFTVIGDVLARTGPERGAPLILDLGCGPGSLTVRLASRFPTARLIGVDADALLLALARAAYAGAAEFVEADLADLDVDTVLAGRGPVDAVVSTSALHWLDADTLGALYRRLAGVLRPGGVLVNGDHLRDAQPVLADLGPALRDLRAVRSGARRVEDWSGWWAAVAEEPALAGVLAERGERRAGAALGGELTVQRHQELLLAAGFAEAGVVWRFGHDTVLVAVR